jgi:hypothetical protein
MESANTLLNELERVSEELGECFSLDALTAWCERRGRLIAGLADLRDLDAAASGRLQAILENGEAARLRGLQIRERLRTEASEITRQRQWSEMCYKVLSTDR